MSHFLNLVLQFPASAIEQEKEMKGTQVEKEEIKSFLLVDMIVYKQNSQGFYKKTPKNNKWVHKDPRIQATHT